MLLGILFPGSQTGHELTERKFRLAKAIKMLRRFYTGVRTINLKKNHRSPFSNIDFDCERFNLDVSMFADILIFLF